MTARREGGIALYAREDLHPVCYKFDRVPHHLLYTWVKVNKNIYVELYTCTCDVNSPPRSPDHDDIISHLITMKDYIRIIHQDASLMIFGEFNDLDVCVFARHLGLSQLG